MNTHKRIVALDFDGVLHSYTSGWKGARTIPDPPVAGAIPWIVSFIDTYCTMPEPWGVMDPEGGYELAIFSSRSRYWGGVRAMKKWLIQHGLDKRYLEVIQFPRWKPPAFVTIDDRALCFTGTFPPMQEVIAFKTWLQKGERP